MTPKPIDDTANSASMPKHPCVHPPCSSSLSRHKTRIHNNTTVKGKMNRFQLPLKETDSQLHWSTSKNGDDDNYIHNGKYNDNMNNTTHVISHANDLVLSQAPAVLKLTPSSQQEQLLRTSFSTATTVCASNLHDTKNGVHNNVHDDHHHDEDSRPLSQQQQEHPPTIIYIHQSQLQPQLQHTNKVNQRLMEAKRKKDIIFQVCRILLQHLARCHPQLYNRAKLLMEQCVRKNRIRQVGYESLTLSIQRTFEHEFPRHWNKATQIYWDAKYIPPHGDGNSNKGALLLASDLDNKPDHQYRTITSTKEQSQNNNKNNKFTNNLNSLSMIELENILRSIGMKDMDISHMDRQDRIRALSYLTTKAAAAASRK